jgi:hypothetical protein
MNLIIEKGIKMPEPGKGRPAGPIRKAVESMKVGDSVALPKRSVEADRFVNTCKRVGIGFATRTVEGNKLRIWRTK